MRIINMMLGKSRGGLEQAALDYTESLLLRDHDVITIVTRGSWAEGKLCEMKAPHEALRVLGNWDIFAARNVSAIAHNVGAEAILCHGNRALSIGLSASKDTISVIGVAHNYKLKRFSQCDGAFAVTKDVLEELANIGIPRAKLYVIPNLVRIRNETPTRTMHLPMRIGSMGRFVSIKGFETYIHALASLKRQNIPFQAILGGDGPLQAHYIDLAQQLSLRISTEPVWPPKDDIDLTFSGWVNDKPAFFESIDAFVLPSKQEAFGIVLIEAMSEGLPCITTASEGPCEIVTPNENAALVDIGDAEAIAQQLSLWSSDVETALEIGKNARNTALHRYSLEEVSRKLDTSLHALQLAISHEKTI